MEGIFLDPGILIFMVQTLELFIQIYKWYPKNVCIKNGDHHAKEINQSHQDKYLTFSLFVESRRNLGKTTKGHES
jgi:hypothetical protein